MRFAGGGGLKRRKGKRGLVRGGEGVKGVCLETDCKNADKPAPRILLA